MCTPLTWTDDSPSERHEREAFIRLCELAIEGARTADGYLNAHYLAMTAVDEPSFLTSEESFRLALEGEDGFDPARIDREVALVRQRAEQSGLAGPEGS